MMIEWIKICKNDGALAGWICLLVSVAMLIAAFILPPAAVIDSSVLAAVGELIAFGVIFKLPEMINSIKDGKTLKMKYHDAEVEVSSKEEE